MHREGFSFKASYIMPRLLKKSRQRHENVLESEPRLILKTSRTFTKDLARPPQPLTAPREKHFGAFLKHFSSLFFLFVCRRLKTSFRCLRFEIPSRFLLLFARLVVRLILKIIFGIISKNNDIFFCTPGQGTYFLSFTLSPWLWASEALKVVQEWKIVLMCRLFFVNIALWLSNLFARVEERKSRWEARSFYPEQL